MESISSAVGKGLVGFGIGLMALSIVLVPTSSLLADSGRHRVSPMDVLVPCQ